MVLPILLAMAALGQAPPAAPVAGTAAPNPIVVPRERTGSSEDRAAHAARTISPTTRALMWRRPAEMGRRLSPTGALAPR